MKRNKKELSQRIKGEITRLEIELKYLREYFEEYEKLNNEEIKK